MSGAPDHLERYIAAATHSLDEADSVIVKSTSGKSNKTKDFARKILGASNQVIPVLESVANIHPITQAVVSVFKAITKLETDRRENDDRIAVTHHTMTLSLFSIKLLANVVRREPIASHLRSPLSRLENLMNEFGNFTSLYYAHKQSLFRVLRAGEYKDRLAEFTTNFAQYKSEINELIGYQTAINVHDMHQEMGNVSGNINKILATLGKDNQKEQAATRMVEEMGGPDAVIRNESNLAQIASQLGEKVNQNIKVTLRQDFEHLMRENEVQFKKKIDGAVMQIEEAVVKSRDAILKQLNEGPHELLEDEDIKIVWYDMKWRNSVKTRLLVDAIHDRFEMKFRKYYIENHTFHPDQWTLLILSKVMFHSSIADAIDEDSSGFISVHETNHFLSRRPDHWSVPEWLSFWAQGWSETNDEYREMIEERLEEILDAANDVPDANEHGMAKFLQIVAQFARSLTMEDEDEDSMNGFDNSIDDEEYADELGRLKYEYRELEEDRIERNLAETVVDDPASLTSVLGQPRIELSLLPLIYVWLGRVHELVVRAQNEDLEEDEDFDPEQVLETMMVILWVFNARMSELTRVWRQQRMSVSQQIQCFCGGIFSAWYAESQKPDNILKKLAMMVDGEDDEDEDGEDDDDEKSDTDGQKIKRLRGDVDQKLQEVWTRMNSRMDSLDSRLGSLDNRLGSIEEMLRALVVGDGGSVKVPTSKASDQKLPSVPRAVRRAQESENSYGRQGNGSPTYGRSQQGSPRQQNSPSYGRQRDNTPPYGRQQDNSPSYGRQRDSSPTYGRQHDNSPSYGRQRDSSPPYGHKYDTSAPSYGRKQNTSSPQSVRKRNSNPYSYSQSYEEEPQDEEEDEEEEEEEEEQAPPSSYRSRVRYV